MKINKNNKSIKISKNSKLLLMNNFSKCYQANLIAKHFGREQSNFVASNIISYSQQYLDYYMAIIKKSNSNDLSFDILINDLKQTNLNSLQLSNIKLENVLNEIQNDFNNYLKIES